MEQILVIVIGLGIGVYLSTQSSACTKRWAAEAEQKRIEFPVECQKHCKSLNSKAIINTETNPQQCFCVLP